MSSRGVNKAIVIGNVGNDPVIGVLPNGSPAVNFTVATSEEWKDKNTGEKKSLTEWHRIASFGKLADIIGQHLSKGDKVYIEGKLRTRSWEKDGAKHYTTEIIADQVQFLSGKKSDKQDSATGAYDQRMDADQGINFDDDIPF